ncbi:hypothetical protein [Croceibacterium soli]|nr:hypothetical protein [Croceibacterium soli]
MTRIPARSRQLTGRLTEAARVAIVTAFALVLIAAGQALPF